MLIETYHSMYYEECYHKVSHYIIPLRNDWLNGNVLISGTINNGKSNNILLRITKI
jgi:hypothetical protein